MNKQAYLKMMKHSSLCKDAAGNLNWLINPIKAGVQGARSVGSKVADKVAPKINPVLNQVSQMSLKRTINPAIANAGKKALKYGGPAVALAAAYGTGYGYGGAANADEISNLRNDITNSNNRIDWLSRRNDSAKKTIKTLDDKLSAANNKIDALNQLQGAQSQKLDAYNNEGFWATLLRAFKNLFGIKD